MNHTIQTCDSSRKKKDPLIYKVRHGNLLREIINEKYKKI